MASFLPELNPHIKIDGTQAIQIRITVGRKLKRIGIGYSIEAKHWHPKNRVVRKTLKNYQKINAAIKSKVIELEGQYLADISQDRHVTAITLQKKATKNIKSGSFISYAKDRISRLPAATTREGQFSIIAKLEAYLNGRDLHFEEITPEFLENYRNYLEKVLKNSPNTIHSNLKKLKASYNDAVINGVYEFERVSPFTRIKIKTTKSARTKLSVHQIQLIEEYSAKEGTMVLHAKNAFLFSYYLQGMRVSDLIQLTWSQVKADRLLYKASKTKKERSRIIINKAQNILNYYKKHDPKPSSYIFPFLRGKIKSNYSEEAWAKLMDSVNSRLRNNLMKIATNIGIEKLSMHVARHTFADIARKKTGNVYLVSDALDHGDMRTTENYFAAARDEENDEFVKIVFDL